MQQDGWLRFLLKRSRRTQPQEMATLIIRKKDVRLFVRQEEQDRIRRPLDQDLEKARDLRLVPEILLSAHLRLPNRGTAGLGPFYTCLVRRSRSSSFRCLRMPHSVSLCVCGGRCGWVVFGVLINERGRPMVLLSAAHEGPKDQKRSRASQIMMTSVVHDVAFYVCY